MSDTHPGVRDPRKGAQPLLLVERLQGKPLLRGCHVLPRRQPPERMVEADDAAAAACTVVLVARN